LVLHFLPEDFTRTPKVNNNFYMMKMKLLLFVCLATLTNVIAQSSKKWKVEGIQFNVGGLMSSKIPSASYATYADFIGETDTSYTDFSSPVQLTNLRLRPIFNGSIHLIQPETNAIQRFGLTIQNKSISSFVMTGTPVIDSTTNIEVYSSIAAYRLDHSSPVLTLDYAYLKKVSMSQRFNLTVGAGAYVGYSLWNTIKSRARINHWPSGNNSGSLWNGRGTSDMFTRTGLGSFSKHTLNLGIYTSFGFEYGLSANQNVAQKWYFTYESRFCYDYFAVKNVPSSWFSFQCSQQLGIKYYLNR
jgi:hypothetical protein